MAASGLCGRSDDAEALVADFVAAGVTIIDLTVGECESVEHLDTSNSERTVQNYTKDITLNEQQRDIEPALDFTNSLDQFEQNGLLK